MKQRLKGEITVFLSLIMMMVLALMLGLLESARVQAARASCLAGADMGMFSLFGEYDRDVLEFYDLFFLDGGYGQGGMNPEAVAARLKYYAGQALGEGSTGNKGGDYLGLMLQGTGLTAVMLAADNDGRAFRYQAVSWIKEELLLSALGLGSEGGENGLLSRLEEGREFLEKGELLMGQADDVSGQIEALRKEAQNRAREAYEKEREEAEAEGKTCTAVLDTSAMEFENPIDTLKRFMEMGILGLAAGEEGLSEGRAAPEDMMSQRSQTSGFGTFGLEMKAGASEGLLFNEYILNKLPCFRDEKQKDFGGLRYQCEYVLGGKETDQDNLKAVLERLLLLRFGINYTYLLSSQEKRLQAETLAAAVSGAVGLPVLEKLMETAILLLWAYEESLTDVRALCRGQKVEFVKNDENFRCRIEQLFSFQPEDAKGESGMDYQDYLRLLLAAEPLKTRTFRCMDMAEHTIRIARNRPEFCLDAGIYALRAEFTYQISPLFFPGPWDGTAFDTECMYSYQP